MDWFEKLTGFREQTYNETRKKLDVREGRLFSSVNRRSYGIGKLELLSLGKMRAQIAGLQRSGRTAVSNVSGDIRALHRQPASNNALFQVASQFNLLEMVGPSITPEDGVTRYMEDRTQGPACAIAAGAATIYRNYFVPVEGQLGQTAQRQIDAAADLRSVLAAMASSAPADLWAMRNGYALPTREGLNAATEALQRLSDSEREGLKERLAIGLHWHVQVTDDAPPDQMVSQAFCSAMPVRYSGLSASSWEPLARLVLEAAYEATLAAAVLNSTRAGARTVFLTRLGGGAFGNHDNWIDDAIRLALVRYRSFGLDVRLVSYGAVPLAMNEMVAEFGAAQ